VKKRLNIGRDLSRCPQYKLEMEGSFKEAFLQISLAGVNHLYIKDLQFRLNPQGLFFLGQRLQKFGPNRSESYCFRIMEQPAPSF
jgi:hypothetical protein